MLGRFGPFVRRNLLRNRRRTLLTALSFASSTFLIVVIQGILHHLDDLPRADGSERRLIVRHATSFLQPLPEAFGPKIQRISGVQGICGLTFYIAIYKKISPEYFFAKMALDAEALQSNYPETHIVDPETGKPRPELYDRFIGDRRAASAGIALYRKYGWKLGDRIAFQGVNGPDLEVYLRSCYDGPENSSFFFRRDYLEELEGKPGRVSLFNVICRDASDLTRVAAEIDGLFANSEAPTVTETEKAFQTGFVEMLGNVRFLLRSIALACAFAMICVSANTLAMTARERANEIAVVKTLGFTPARVLALLLVEVSILCAASAALGGAAAVAVFRWDVIGIHDLGGGFLRGARIPIAIALAAIPLGVFVGWISAAVPFVRVVYAPIAPALRRAG